MPGSLPRPGRRCKGRSGGRAQLDLRTDGLEGVGRLVALVASRPRLEVCLGGVGVADARPRWRPGGSARRRCPCTAPPSASFTSYFCSSVTIVSPGSRRQVPLAAIVRYWASTSRSTAYSHDANSPGFAKRPSSAACTASWSTASALASATPVMVVWIRSPVQPALSQNARTVASSAGSAALGRSGTSAASLGLTAWGSAWRSASTWAGVAPTRSVASAARSPSSPISGRKRSRSAIRSWIRATGTCTAPRPASSEAWFSLAPKAPTCFAVSPPATRPPSTAAGTSTTWVSWSGGERSARGAQRSTRASTSIAPSSDSARSTVLPGRLERVQRLRVVAHRRQPGRVLLCLVLLGLRSGDGRRRG